ncbi:hypothetical protein [Alkalihalobacterium bogoriense]|uniref:hypothetical protein n=1 Tax=Alkalihalobacterium bogoriense TaxID=246272 RepID=UPI00047983D1|nr:hypothetical protein [Alkalihalobacterium bogoriense]
MYILKDIDLENDEVIESKPICLKNKRSNEIYCLGMLVEREMVCENFEGERYYQFVYFYGKSPINFNVGDYEQLEKDYSFNMDLEMISDFRYSYSDYRNDPAVIDKDNIRMMQVNSSWRYK